MSFKKKLRLCLYNKRRYPKIKTYNFYRKDFWGIIRLKRQYRLKKAVYALLKGKKKFYYIFLYQIYHGVKFFIKRHTYRGNLLIVKKILKFFYYKINDKQIGKLNYFFKGTTGNLVNKFFSLLERRLDVLLVRCLYFFFIKESYNYILCYNVFINNLRIKKPNYLVKISDIISIFAYPKVPPFFFKTNTFTIDYFKVNSILKKKIKKIFLFLKLLFFLIFFFIKKKIKNKIMKKFNFNKKDFFKIIKIIKKLKSKKIKLKFKIKLLKKINIFFFLFFENNYNFFFFYIIKIFYAFSFYKVYAKNYKKYIFRRLLNVIIIFLNKIKMIINPKYFFLNYKKIFNFTPQLAVRLKTYNQLLKIKVKKFYGYFFGKQKNFFSKVIKKFRFYKISKKLYFRLKNKKISFYSGYPPYVEVSYKLHKIILIKEPTIEMVKYPFLFKNFLFFNYFKQKSYF